MLYFIHTGVFLMDFDVCVTGRRSIRVYKDEPLSKELVDELLDAGVCAPSGMNYQPWRFIVIQDRETINKLSDKTKELVLQQEWASAFKERMSTEDDVIFYGAPLLILVLIEKKEPMMRDVNLLDSGLLAQNMFLKAYDLGLGSCFIGFASFLNMSPETLTEIGVPENHELVAPLIFGYPAEEPESKPRETKILKWIK